MHCDEYIVALEIESQLGGTLPHAPTLKSRRHMRINAGPSLPSRPPSEFTQIA